MSWSRPTRVRVQPDTFDVNVTVAHKDPWKQASWFHRLLLHGPDGTTHPCCSTASLGPASPARAARASLVGGSLINAGSTLMQNDECDLFASFPPSLSCLTGLLALLSLFLPCRWWSRPVGIVDRLSISLPSLPLLSTLMGPRPTIYGMSGGSDLWPCTGPTPPRGRRTCRC